MDELGKDHDKCIKQVPRYGFIVPLNHKYPLKWKQMWRVRWREFFSFVPMALRYRYNDWQIARQGRVTVMDFLNQQTGQQIYGAPIGGIGTGTIGRGFKGEFCRYSLVPGIYQYDTVLGNQFIVTIRDTNGKTVYNQVLSPTEKPKQLRSWKWGFNGKNGKYTALYPRAWTEYNIEEANVKLICRQISPVIPNNYKDSSLPCAAFIWEIINENNIDLDVSITFTFQSGMGNTEDLKGEEKWTECFEYKNKVTGMMIHQELKGMPCTYAIASRASADVDISRMLKFDPFGDGRDLWESLERSGKLTIDREQKSAPTKNHVASAVCASVRVEPNTSRELEFCLTWDMPKIHFHFQMKEYLRYYTKYFYDDKQSVAPELCHYTLMHYNAWESDIYNWQRPVLEDIDLPDWYKSALFNELYYVADGGTIWLRQDDNEQFSMSDPRHEYGRFAYLEGHEYRMYNTYDVHFYAAFALAQLWPNLQASVQYEIRDTIQFEDSSMRLCMFEGNKCKRKTKGGVPHDIGDPYEEPFKLINAYPIHDVSCWKDLNPKFVLSCYRDYCITGNKQFLGDVWPSIKEVMETTLQWDTDNDGLIENTGFPDQTYDTWVTEGPSSYCGSLWLAALRCAIEISKLVGDIKIGNKYSEVLEKGKVSFQEKLWNGRYYNFDSSKSDHRKCIMSDQLCGQLFLKACGFEHQVFPADRVKSALKTIFENNVMKYKNGNQGAVNGFLPNGRIDTMTVQSEEMWTGVSYALSALMIHEGMTQEGFRTAEGVYRTVWEKIGMAFETPEALYEDNAYRSIGYMRPLAIWAIHHAWMKKKNQNYPDSSHINPDMNLNINN